MIKIRGSESFGFENSQEKKSVLVKGVTAWASWKVFRHLAIFQASNILSSFFVSRIFTFTRLICTPRGDLKGTLQNLPYIF